VHIKDVVDKYFHLIQKYVKMSLIIYVNTHVVVMMRNVVIVIQKMMNVKIQ